MASSEHLVTIGNASQLSTVIKGDFIQGRGEARCVFVGRSNVGKSSLINALLDHGKLAQVSKTPGKTRLIHCYWAPNLKRVVVDLPGYGYAKIARGEKKKWDDLIGSYLDADPKIEYLVLLLDSRHGPTSADEEMMDFFQDWRERAVVVMTKIDELRGQSVKHKRKSEVAKALKELGWGLAPIHWVSVHTEEGLDDLQRTLESGAKAR